MTAQIQPILEAHPDLTERSSADNPAVNCPQDKVLEVLTYLKEEQGFDFLCDLVSVYGKRQNQHLMESSHLSLKNEFCLNP